MRVRGEHNRYKIIMWTFVPDENRCVCTPHNAWVTDTIIQQVNSKESFTLWRELEPHPHSNFPWSPHFKGLSNHALLTAFLVGHDRVNTLQHFPVVGLKD